MQYTRNAILFIEDDSAVDLALSFLPAVGEVLMVNYMGLEGNETNARVKILRIEHGVRDIMIGHPEPHTVQLHGHKV